MDNSFAASMNLGFGFRPDESIPDDIKSWAKSQLTGGVDKLGVSSHGSQAVEPWPSRYDLSLNDRVKSLQTLRSKKEKLWRDKKYSDSQIAVKVNDLYNEYDPRRYDELKLIHSSIYSTNQVRQRFVNFWANHFTVGGHVAYSDGLIGHYIENAIDGSILGSFDELLYKVTTHPAMLIYLDNVFNIGPRSKKAKECRNCQVGLNDNLGRELLELHTLSPIAGYTESDINGIARILAGWGVLLDDLKNKETRQISNHWDAYVSYHAEPGSKKVLGRSYSAGKRSLRKLTNYLSSRSETRSNLASKLCRHFVSDPPRKEDVVKVVKVWDESNGNLVAIHEAVIDLVVSNKSSKFNWPYTWLMQVNRISGANFFIGWQDVAAKGSNGARPHETLIELGQSFWAIRQPNGYSDRASDWVSAEHMERRIRFADAVFNLGKPIVSPEEIAVRMGLSAQTVSLISSFSSKRQQFVALTCSSEFMGV